MPLAPAHCGERRRVGRLDRVACQCCSDAPEAGAAGSRESLAPSGGESLRREAGQVIGRNVTSLSRHALRSSPSMSGAKRICAFPPSQCTTGFEASLRLHKTRRSFNAHTASGNARPRRSIGGAPMPGEEAADPVFAEAVSNARSVAGNGSGKATARRQSRADRAQTESRRFRERI